MLAERYERPIDLLVTDVVMPEMGGSELVRRMAALRPDLKVLYISGYTGDELMRRGVEGTGAHFCTSRSRPMGSPAECRRSCDGETPATT